MSHQERYSKALRTICLVINHLVNVDNFTGSFGTITILETTTLLDSITLEFAHRYYFTLVMCVPPIELNTNHLALCMSDGGAATD